MHTKTLVPALLILLIGVLECPPYERAEDQQSTTASAQALHYKSIDLIRDVDALTNTDRLQYRPVGDIEVLPMQVMPAPTEQASPTPTELPCLQKCAASPLCIKWCEELKQNPPKDGDGS